MITNNTNYGKPGCKDAVFQKLKIIPGKNPKIWRMDAANVIIKYDHYGPNNISSKYNWEVDHIIPKAQGGSDHIDNLQGLNRRDNNRCRDRMNKPGASIKTLHDVRKQKQLDRDPTAFDNKTTHSKIKENALLNVKQSPVTNAQLAKIIKINNKQNTVTVHWVFGDYQEEIRYDIDMFEDVPTRRTSSLLKRA